MRKGRPKSTISKERLEDYPIYTGAMIDDEKVALFIKREYQAQDVEKIGTGRSMDFWAAIGEWKGEQRLLLLTINPRSGYVGGCYSLPLEAMEGLEEFICKVRLEAGRR